MKVGFVGALGRCWDIFCVKKKVRNLVGMGWNTVGSFFFGGGVVFDEFRVSVHMLFVVLIH